MMFDSVSRLLGFGGVGLDSQKEVELWEENRRLRVENVTLREEFQKEIYKIGERNHNLESEIYELKSEVDELKNMLREAKYPATVRLEREMKVRIP